MSADSSVVSKIYNSLSNVFDANHSLIERGRESCLHEFLQIISAYGLIESVGLRLLHRHNFISSSEVMVERSVLDTDGFALITRVESTAILDENFVPNSWVYADVGFVPMEYSHVELLNDPTCNPETYTDFFIELGSKLRDLGLSTLVGPALTSSPLVEKNRPQGATQMLEMTALDDRANILRYVLDNPGLKEQHIETFWSWGGGSEAPDSPKEPGDANPSRAPRVNPMRTCTRICPSVQNPPVHQGTFIHRSQ